jgi:hypothetical protein
VAASGRTRVVSRVVGGHGGGLVCVAAWTTARRALHRADEADAASVLHCRTASSSAARPRRVRRRPRESCPRNSALADHPARLFVCARCRVQVLLCSRCDRGQRYCGRVCSGAARRQSLRAAASRYQRSWGGRIAHAARSRRWRQRCCERVRDRAAAVEAAAVDGGVIEFVTHQGCPVPSADAPLPLTDEHAAAVTGALASPLAVRCRRCSAPLAPWVRQGFLRHGMRRWPARVIEPGP